MGASVSTRTLRLSYGRQGGKIMKFPPETRGFLYYHKPPKAPPLVGDIRFRFAQNLTGFDDGMDLLSPKSRPWHVSLLVLATVPRYAAVREQLMQEGLITPTVVKKCAMVRKQLNDAGHGVMRWENFLYYLRQPFYVAFHSGTVQFLAVTNEKVGICSLPTPFLDWRMQTSPYGGSGIVQLEPYVDPERPDENRVAFRVLRVIEPVHVLLKDYDYYIHPPTEGSLVQRSFSWQAPAAITRSLDTDSLRSAMMLPPNYGDIP